MRKMIELEMFSRSLLGKGLGVGLKVGGEGSSGLKKVGRWNKRVGS